MVSTSADSIKHHHHLLISDLLAMLTSTPTLTVEKQVAGRLVKRMLAETKGNIINVPTKGRYVYIASALHNSIKLFKSAHIHSQSLFWQC